MYIIGTAIMKALDLGVGPHWSQHPGGRVLKLLFSEDSAVWGAQLVGSDSFAKRVDVFAAAIQSRKFYLEPYSFVKKMRTSVLID